MLGWILLSNCSFIILRVHEIFSTQVSYCSTLKNGRVRNLRRMINEYTNVHCELFLRSSTAKVYST